MFKPVRPEPQDSFSRERSPPRIKIGSSKQFSMPDRSQNRAASSSSVPFLVTDENRLAYTAITELSRDTTKARGKFVFLHARAGTGKSHLCDVLVHEWRNRPASKFKVFSSLECQELLSIDIDAETLLEPNQQLAPFDLVVFEDIHQLMRHQRIQKSLCWVLDDLIRRGTSILITSASAAGELLNCSTRLANRFRSGVTVTIHPLETQSREQLLTHYCTHLQIAVPLPVLRAFARQFEVSARELLGILLRFEEFAKMQRRPSDLSFARQFLKSELQAPSTTIDSIAKAVAREFGVLLSEMKSAARDQNIVLPRQCAMYLVREILHEHYTTIGKYFGNRSHSTVLHSVGRIKEQLQDDPALRRQLNAAQKNIR